MTKAQKKMLLAVTAILAFLFIAMLVIVPLITVPEGATESTLNFVAWFVDLKSAIATDIAFYAFILGLIAVGYYFLVYRPKLSGKKR